MSGRSRKQTLWAAIASYEMSLNTEYEKQERGVLDQAIDAALADSATADAPDAGMGVAEIVDAQNALLADAPPEPTEEMVEAKLVRGLCGAVRDRYVNCAIPTKIRGWLDSLDAALATAHIQSKEG